MSAARVPGTRGRDQGGFVLPVALLILVLLAMISVTGLHLARSDYRAAEATRQAAVALAAADAGAARTVALWSQAVPALPPAGDSLVVDWQELPDGSLYRSVVRRSSVATGEIAPPRVLVRTTARVRPPGTARRTVVVVVEAPGQAAWCCDAALKVRGGLRVTGAKGMVPNSGVAGEDHVPPEWGGGTCPASLTDGPGALVPNVASVDVRSGGVITGAPPVAADAGISAADFTTFGSLTYAQLAAAADHRFAGNTRFRDELAPAVSGGACLTALSTNWGAPLDPAGPCGGWAPIVHVAGNLTIQGADQGQGLLLVDGDLTIQGPFRFHGVAIVLGRMRFTSAGRIFGGVLARGGAGGGGQSEISSGGRVMYSSCAVQKALARTPGGVGGGSGGTARQLSWFEVVG